MEVVIAPCVMNAIRNSADLDDIAEVLSRGFTLSLDVTTLYQ